ncbi:MAG: Gfo/Idh/MocA family oxidoreductase [Terriglobia bacterium]|jgi:predicted dehydrogenase
MASLRFAMFGAGFWSHYQLAGWKELAGAECVALCDPVRSRAEARAKEFGISHVYEEPREVFRNESLDFVDVVTNPETHSDLVHLAAANKTAVICQKPMATSYLQAQGMVEVCRQAGVPFFVHENWRWQTPIRQLKRVLDEGRMGQPFRARLTMISGFPVFDNQPFLKEAEELVLTDVGTHVLDAVRFLFGEAKNLYCQIHRIHSDIRGEDVATVMLKMRGGATVLCELGYAGNYLENDRFPETFAFVEGEKGSVHLAPDFWIRMTTAEGTLAKRYPPPSYSWVDPAYAVAQASIVACHANILRSLRGEDAAETTGEDNLKTLRLVFGSYQSARTGQALRLD